MPVRRPRARPGPARSGAWIRPLSSTPTACIPAGHCLRGSSVTPSRPRAALAASSVASCTPNLGPFIEYAAAPQKKESWYTPAFDVKDGVVAVPTGPGLGLTIDPDFLRKAERV